MKIYCHQCGTAITYANAEAQPNFCHKCGANISVASETIEQDEPHNDVKFNSTLNELQVEIENGKSFAELAAEEFLFVPVGQNSGSVAVQLEATSGTIVAEYAYFTKG